MSTGPTAFEGPDLQSAPGTTTALPIRVRLDGAPLEVVIAAAEARGLWSHEAGRCADHLEAITGQTPGGGE